MPCKHLLKMTGDRTQPAVQEMYGTHIISRWQKSTSGKWSSIERTRSLLAALTTDGSIFRPVLNVVENLKFKLEV